MKSEGLSNFSNVITSLAAIAAVCIGWMGLHTWKSQQIWQLNHELARRALVAIYHYRNALYDVRHPMMYAEEMKDDSVDAPTDPLKADRYEGRYRAYSRRWQKHAEIDVDLGSILIEADAVWGSALTDLVKPLRELRNELFGHILMYLDSAKPHLGRDEIIMYRDLLKPKQHLLYDRLKDDDLFRKDFSEKLSAVEAYLRKKLGRY